MAHSIEGLYSIWDRKAGYYLPVFNKKSDAEALREFQNLVVNSETPISRYPADFDLVKIGTMEMETGYIESLKNTHALINGLVSLQEAHEERRRYNTILKLDSPEEQAESPSAAS